MKKMTKKPMMAKPVAKKAMMAKSMPMKKGKCS